MADDCVFCQIVAGELPADVRDRGPGWLVFADIAPAAPLHLLAIPTRHIAGVADITDGDRQLVAELVGALTGYARRSGVEADGYRLAINQGRDGAQTVPHLHVHLLAGRLLGWPPG